MKELIALERRWRLGADAIYRATLMPPARRSTRCMRSGIRGDGVWRRASGSAAQLEDSSWL